MKTLTVDLADRSYDIQIDKNLLASMRFAEEFPYEQRLVLTNNTIYALHSDRILSLVDGDKARVVIIEDGERYKNLESFAEVHTRLLELEFNRRSLLIAFGGGVIGDLAGFVASTYQRGIDFIQIPTTLLAQVDSSVGGKTAVNHPHGKNMIGTFYQPKRVLIDLSLLKTLPQREYVSGLAEVLKYGFIQDAEFLEWMRINYEAILAKDPEVISEMIYRSCACKKFIVDQDERESGIRATLNLGHTFGHAIEKLMKYQGVLHGEAVAIGMNMAGYLSCRMGLISKKDQLYITSLLHLFDLPCEAPQSFTPQEFLNVMRLDKKNLTQKIRFVLLNAVGQAMMTDDIPEEYIIEAIEFGTP
ncbi:MAG TPA: 3-dehydroquinate synthase [Candidatus Ignatzschineria merdigallinarum]|uniref:3-dehydroquinate synthase n=1 Tax=Candidatus Ignatzschineria merdigallinarum TaxID=2838621 RepID=A0A9D1TUJ6_9GAMM|nr:3-dehydroquinate synthase [Candidatus Ignatzschineria merdigallinarum]